MLIPGINGREFKEFPLPLGIAGMTHFSQSGFNIQGQRRLLLRCTRDPATVIELFRSRSLRMTAERAAFLEGPNGLVNFRY